MIGSTLHRFKTDQKYLIWDTETEGLNLAFHRPWEIAYAVCTHKEILSMHTAYIAWPDLTVSRGAAAKTRFDYGEYRAKAKPAAEVLAHFESFLLDPTIYSVGHSILGFDTYMHANWRRAATGATPDWSWLYRLIDTNALSKAIQKGWKPDIGSPESFLSWSYKAANYVETGLKSNLAATGRLLGVAHDEKALHRAEADIVLNHGIFREMLYKLEF